MNCGIYVKEKHERREDDFYSVIESILELTYFGLPNKVFIFYCEWFDPSSIGIRVLSLYNIVDINVNRRYALYDLFILTQKARQVYYVPYPKMCHQLRGLFMSIKTKPRVMSKFKIMKMFLIK